MPFEWGYEWAQINPLQYEYLPFRQDELLFRIVWFLWSVTTVRSSQEYQQKGRLSRTMSVVLCLWLTSQPSIPFTEQQEGLLPRLLLCQFYFGHSEEKVLKYNKNCWQLCSSEGKITCSHYSLQRFGFFVFLPCCRFDISREYRFWLENGLLTELKPFHQQATIRKKASMPPERTGSWGSSFIQPSEKERLSAEDVPLKVGIWAQKWFPGPKWIPKLSPLAVLSFTSWGGFVERALDSFLRKLNW